MRDESVRGSNEASDEAEFVVGIDGRVEDANDVALRLLGVTIDELRTAPPGTFSVPTDPDEQAALRQAWLDERATGAVGESAVRRADGQTIRVKYISGVRPDARYVVAMRPVEGAGTPTTILSTASHALAAWRAAERRLEVLEPGGPDWRQAEADVASFREQYRRLFDARRQD
jgi:PAS domain S-box-containing protein